MKRSLFLLSLFALACVPIPPSPLCTPPCEVGHVCSQGVCSPSPSVGHEAHKQALSGSRLKARILTASDGAKQFLGFFDTALNEACTFQAVSSFTLSSIQDPSLFCLPSSASFTLGQVFYSDPSCSPSRRFAAGSPCREAAKQFVVAPEGTAPVCGTRPSVCVRLGSSVPLPAKVYRRSDGVCQPDTSQDGSKAAFFDASEECSESLFARLWVSAEEKAE